MKITVMITTQTNSRIEIAEPRPISLRVMVWL